jgi:CDP-6-deoxy-D-xylo-4-hexulose-3-dehydrase|tara:strand:+ start:171 stop:1367 length:1197 start_codon:yes stop_codon:yes gene_type:complete
MKNIRVPYGMAVHDEQEIKAVVKTLRSSTQMGKSVSLFEKKISKLFSKKYGLMVNSGSSALFLAFASINLPKGSEVITPALTFATTVASIVQNNLVPVFIDVKRLSYCVDEKLIENMISKKTRAICIPNLIGNIPNWIAIKRIAKKHNLIVIEDSADALGSKISNKSSGFYSDISITSFYGSHIINCAGNGGMVCFNNKKYFDKAKLLRSWGRSSSLFKDSEKIENRFNVKISNIYYDAKFIFSEIGYNFEPNEIGASYGLVQLNKLKNNIALREKNFQNHQKFFKKFNKWFELPDQEKNIKTGWLAYPLLVKKNLKIDRRKIQIYLEKKNIQTRVVFTGNILKQPGFRKIKSIKDKNGYPNADNVMRNGFLIAVHHGLNKKMINHIYKSFEELFKKY